MGIFHYYQDQEENGGGVFGPIMERCADSGEGYKVESDCLHGIEIVKKEAPTAKVVKD